MKYYGQWETDKIIEQYFPSKKSGMCVEVGAYDGIKGSNTKYFEDIGWFTVCVEPNPYIFPLLCRNRLGDCYGYACSYENKSRYLEIFDFNSGIQSSLTSLNTDERLVRDYAEAITSRHEVLVKTITLDNLLEKYPYHFDFLSIDTEGTELNVLQGLNLKKYDIKLLVIENNYNDKDVRDYLAKFGYKIDQRYKINDFYVKV